MKTSVHDYTLPELRQVVVAELALPPYVASQLYEWLYRHGSTAFDTMTNLAKPVRAALAERFSCALPEVAAEHASADGTTKYLFRLHDGKTIESVWIPAVRRDHTPRNTLCISTQAGCAMGCTFCHTATMGLQRHLTQGEILGQILAVQQRLPLATRLTNIVMMGMGEPLHNYESVVNAIRIMIDDRGLAFGKRRVTLSTVGLAPAIRRLGEERLGVKLALSLHATTDELRNQLIPMGRKYALAEILAACHDFCRAGAKGTRVTFEYLLLRDVNDSHADAERLVRIVSQLPSKVNLIPWNPFPGARWDRPDDARIEAFAQWLRAKHVQVNTRISRGQDILAACGQLATAKGGV
ncbi:MAG: 23S rRNA (adenine(2503)-C(2))-methyltransferase RlmN [Deltaproteobacteria bacterium]|nr:23S rRNA (adenine(2503)-C(2))-methyltransferase RlmN [Deltaproteobacteria bacterium]